MTKTRTLHARFDGKVLKPEDPVNLKQDMHYLITVEEEETAVHMEDAQNKLDICFTALVDILGYSDLIKDCDGNYESLSNTLKKFKNIISPIQSWLHDYDACDESKVSVFSDSIFVNVPFLHDFDGRAEIIFTINKIALYQFNLAIEGYFIRGCATVNYSYFDDSIAFGPGLLEVAECEKKKAKYPRICLTNNIMNIIHGYNNNNNNNKGMVDAWNSLSNRICVDEKGKYFINYLFWVIDVIELKCSVIKKERELLDPLYLNVLENTIFDDLRAHKNKIVTNLKDHKDSDVAAKYIWLAEYHNFFCKEHFSATSDLSDLIINGYDGNNHQFTKMKKIHLHHY